MKQRNHDLKGVWFVCFLLVASVRVYTSDVNIYKYTLDAFKNICSVFHVATFLAQKMLPNFWSYKCCHDASELCSYISGFTW